MVIVDIGTKSTLAMYGLFQAGDVTARAKIPEPVAASHMARAYKTEKAPGSAECHLGRRHTARRKIAEH